jgi:hypothetical protein
LSAVPAHHVREPRIASLVTMPLSE